MLQIGTGNTASVYLLDNGKAAKVFHEYISPAAIQNERRLSHLIMEAGVRCPKIYGEDMIEGQRALLFERIDGISLNHRIKKQPVSVFQLLKKMAELQSEFHKKNVNGLPSYKCVLREKMHISNELAKEENRKILNLLEHLPDGKSLCHGDFHPENILLSSKGPVIIDWNDAACGHPLADLARSILLLRYGGLQGSSPFKRKAQRLMRRMLAESYQAYYLKKKPFNKEGLKKWLLPAAAARLAERIPAIEKQELIKLIRTELLR